MRNSGSALIVVAILVMLIGALSAAFQVMSITYFRSSSSSTEHQLAVLAAESGAAYYIKHLQVDPDYFATNPPPLAPLPVGAASFQVESATPVSVLWKVVIVGKYAQDTYRLGTILGKPFIAVPRGLVIGGAGGPPSDVMFTMTQDSLMATYDPTAGPFDPLTAGDGANIAMNGSMNMENAGSIRGGVSLTGTLVTGDPLNISGGLTENATEQIVADIDPYVIQVLNDSQAANDNAALASIFGGMYSDSTPAGENYGSLVVNDGGTYVVPAGTYRFKKFEVRQGSTVIFDTSAGDVNLVYIGAGQGTGAGNDLIVTQSSSVKIDPGGTENNLLTVLGTDADFKVKGGSLFGQAIGDENNAGYSQIVSMGGNFSSDDIKASTGSSVYGRVYAAGHMMTIELGSTWYGSALVGEAVVNAGTFAIDIGTLGADLETRALDAVLLGYWDE